MPVRLPTYEPRVTAQNAGFVPAGPQAGADSFARVDPGVAKLGQALEGLGHRILERDRINTETFARNAMTSAQIDLKAANDGWRRAHRGIEADQAGKAAAKWFEDRKRDVSGAARNDRERKLFGVQFDALKRDTLAGLEAYANGEAERARAESRASQNELFFREAVDRAADPSMWPEDFDRSLGWSLAFIESNLRASLHEAGAGPEAVAKALADARGRLYAECADAMGEARGAQAALDFLANESRRKGMGEYQRGRLERKWAKRREEEAGARRAAERAGEARALLELAARGLEAGMAPEEAARRLPLALDAGRRARLAAMAKSLEAAAARRAREAEAARRAALDAAFARTGGDLVLALAEADREGVPVRAEDLDRLAGGGA